MKKSYLLGIDVGTTGTKAIAFDLDGGIAATSYQEYSCTYPAPGWVEQDCAMLTDAVTSTCRAVAEKLGADAAGVRSISVSAQRSCTIFVDSSGNPMKEISWLDNRPVEQVEQIAAKIGRERYYEITGMPLATTWILPKILHTRDTDPELWGKTVRIVQLQDMILHALGADDFYSDEPDATFWGMWDSQNFCYSKELLDAFDLPVSLFPSVKRSGEKAGVLSAAMAKATGLPEDAALCIGIGDQNSAALGAGIVEPGYLSVSIGTGGLATVPMSHFYRDPKGQAMITHHASHGTYTFEGLQNAAAGIFRWFRDEVAALEVKEYGDKVYKILDEMADKTPVGSNGLLMLPYFAGSAAPRWNAEAQGCFIGMSLRHTRADMARAVMEGITLEQKDILQSLSSCGETFKVVRIVGGASNSRFWSQLQADIYGLPCETLQVKDAAALGAAICAGVGCGAFADLNEAVSRMVHVDTRYEPNMENFRKYEKIYALYTKAYEALDQGGVFHASAVLQKELYR